MSKSVHDDDGEIVLRAVPLDDPGARALEAILVAEMIARYGGSGPGPIPVEHFAAPEGCFVLAQRADTAVACGGFRHLRSAVAEIKRMYVAPDERGRGLGRRMLAELERRAAAAGYRQTWLETGLEQPEAMALYTAAGYRPMAPYGEFRYDARSRCYYRTLGP
ncbi:MAG: GNAT family N-acetyltransferase [Acidimicrobiales bacterium]